MTRAGWIPTHRRVELRQLAVRSHQVVSLAAATGVLTGTFVALFDRVIVEDGIDRILRFDPRVLAFCPGIGLILGWLLRRVIGRGRVSPATSDEYLHAFHDRHHILDWRSFAARMSAAVVGLGLGAPMGLEGPSLYAGATIGSGLQRRLPRSFRQADRRVLMIAGAAAGVAAIFKAPATGAVFAIEVPYQGDVARRMLLPALVASATGYLTFVAFNGTAALFPIDGNVTFVMIDLLGALVIGVAAGLGARSFAWLLRRAKRLAAGPKPFAVTVASALLLAALFGVTRALTGESLMIGSGYDAVRWAATPGHSIPLLLAVLALRGLGTAAAVAGGGVGGLFVPLVVSGALGGAVIGQAIDHGELDLFIVIGVAAFLGAGYRVPLAAVMFVAETTGRPAFVVPGLLAAVAAELVMGPASVTAYQKEVEELRHRTSEVPVVHSAQPVGVANEDDAPAS